jgi:hypothetical protein
MLSRVSRGDSCFRQFGEWYVATHSDTAEKHSVLVRLKQRLGLRRATRQRWR